MMLLPRFLTYGTILISLLLFIYPAHNSFGQAREHETRASIHPCGNPNGDLAYLTALFQQKWDASYSDLHPMDVASFLKHYNIGSAEIVKIRIFQSKHQPKLGVVLARKFVNYLDGKPLVELYCAVTVNNKYILGISADHLSEVLKGSDEDT